MMEPPARVINSQPNRSPPMLSPDQDSFLEDNYLTVPPKSSKTQGCMFHAISHRFSSTLKVTASNCQLCEKPMFLGYKCRECKYKCHRDCVDKVPPSCGLPVKYVDFFKEVMKKEGRIYTNISSHPTSRVTSPSSVNSDSLDSSNKVNNSKDYICKTVISIPSSPELDSSSNNSSCTSSTPSSPALFVNNASRSLVPKVQSFSFPNTGEYSCSTKTSNEGITIVPNFNSSTVDRLLSHNSELIETQKSSDSDKTISAASGSNSTSGSEKTLAGRVDSIDSQVSESDVGERSWPRQNSLTLREWDIPYDELVIEEEIGTGRFGTVFKGKWHGNVTIKRFNMDNVVDDRKALEAFQQEVATFRKTRHENLVLFMGACMKPPHLAIVTSLCKGLTLYTHIHHRNDKFNLNRIIIITQQITQGMGYLHARGIVHKDLKTKNIFYENGKVVITDFGLCSVFKLCKGNRGTDCLTIPKGWLCYLAPELIRSLRVGVLPQERDDLPFSKATDVYAFGTVWYELLFGEWPHKGKSPEVIIWQIGKGMKQSLINLQSSKEVKDLLMICWAFKPKDRPDFGKLLDILSKLPKKRLQRSPSHPIYLRSAESMF